MNKIYRSKTNKMVSGLCAGIGEHFNIDPTLIRIAYVFLGLKYFGTAFIVYLICSIVIPEDDGVIHGEDDSNNYGENMSRNTPIFIGGGLIIWGSFLLAKFLFPWFNLRIAQISRLWPALLILLGVFILLNSRDK